MDEKIIDILTNKQKHQKNRQICLFSITVLGKRKKSIFTQYGNLQIRFKKKTLGKKQQQQNGFSLSSRWATTTNRTYFAGFSQKKLFNKTFIICLSQSIIVSLSLCWKLIPKTSNQHSIGHEYKIVNNVWYFNYVVVIIFFSHF